VKLPTHSIRVGEYVIDQKLTCWMVFTDRFGNESVHACDPCSGASIETTKTLAKRYMRLMRYRKRKKLPKDPPPSPPA
jgi:hypothetical protein